MHDANVTLLFLYNELECLDITTYYYKAQVVILNIYTSRSIFTSSFAKWLKSCQLDIKGLFSYSDLACIGGYSMMLNYAFYLTCRLPFKSQPTT